MPNEIFSSNTLVNLWLNDCFKPSLNCAVVMVSRFQVSSIRFKLADNLYPQLTNYFHIACKQSLQSCLNKELR